jgi:hypothetical protein
LVSFDELELELPHADSQMASSAMAIETSLGRHHV